LTTYPKKRYLNSSKNIFTYFILYFIFMLKQNKQAFTLVELIVVITILAILWTIGFISLQWYSANARDSTRTTDLVLIEKTFELYHINEWMYPDTTGWGDVTYSWAKVWTQGTFWKTTYRSVKRLSNIPLDPLTKDKYVYSLTSNKQEYQLAAISETGENVAMDNSLNTYANEESVMLKVIWNYNGTLLKVITGSTTYVLAVPSIITSSSWGILKDIIDNWDLAFNWFKNLPYQYANNWYKKIWEIWRLNLVNSGWFVVYNWDISELKNNGEKRKELVKNLQGAYTGTAIATNSSIKNIVEINLDDNTTKGALKIALLWTSIVNNKLWGSIMIASTEVKEDPIISWNDSNGRKYKNNTYAKTCNDYKNPVAPYKYDWDTWNWVYWIKPTTGSSPFKVYCDMTTDNWGWTQFFQCLKSDSCKKSWNTLYNVNWTTDNYWANHSSNWSYLIWKKISFSPSNSSNFMVKIENTTNNKIW